MEYIFSRTKFFAIRTTNTFQYGKTSPKTSLLQTDRSNTATAKSTIYGSTTQTRVWHLLGGQIRGRICLFAYLRTLGVQGLPTQHNRSNGSFCRLRSTLSHVPRRSLSIFASGRSRQKRFFILYELADSTEPNKKSKAMRKKISRYGLGIVATIFNWMNTFYTLNYESSFYFVSSAIQLLAPLLSFTHTSAVVGVAGI